MADYDLTVRDSSIWGSSTSHVNNSTGQVHIGIVREENFDTNTNTYMYLVEITLNARRALMHCRLLSRFGGPYNYEEWNPTPNVVLVAGKIPRNYSARVGDVVAVAPIDGKYVNGVILGSLKHPSRKPKIKSGETAYASEFNGLETTIDNDGAYKVKFQGVPLTAAAMKKTLPGTPIIPAVYNPASANSYFTFEKDGSYEVSDANLVLPQKIRMDKPGGKLIITSGLVTVTIEKLSQKIAVKCLDVELSPTKSFKLTTLDTEISSLKSVKIKGAKIAIGFGGTELFDTLIQLIDAFGTLIVNSPVGPCSPLQAAPTWAQIVILKTKLSLVKGSL